MSSINCSICNIKIDKTAKTFTDVRGDISHTACFLNKNKKDYLQMMLDAAEVAGVNLASISDWSQTSLEKVSEMSEQHLDINYINLIGGQNDSF